MLDGESTPTGRVNSKESDNKMITDIAQVSSEAFALWVASIEMQKVQSIKLEHLMTQVSIKLTMIIILLGVICGLLTMGFWDIISGFQEILKGMV